MQVASNENKTPVSGDFKNLFLSKNVEGKREPQILIGLPIETRGWFRVGFLATLIGVSF